MTNPFLVAMVLPQFHPIPENDAWWGKGFTEWTNVVKAQPLFNGHYQPHLPGELGFYDLRLHEARESQAELAKEHNIGGFCYYHYWFNGRRLLQRPVDDILSSGKPNLPFCLCWANENWTRAWDGRQRDILMEQRYSEEDDIKHIEHLLNYFADPRYIRVQGKPFFIVYKVSSLPNPRRTFDIWRERAIKSGIGDLYLAQFEAMGYGSVDDPRNVGLDISIEFSPDWRSLGGQYYVTRKARLAISLGMLPKAYARHQIFDYSSVVEKACNKANPEYPFVRCVSPGFDSSPRRPEKNAVILLNNTPELYETWLDWAIKWTAQHDATGRCMVFINAWNEWAEGNHLEPDIRHGRAFLEATRNAFQRSGT